MPDDGPPIRLSEKTHFQELFEKYQGKVMNIDISPSSEPESRRTTQTTVGLQSQLPSQSAVSNWQGIQPPILDQSQDGFQVIYSPHEPIAHT